MEGKLFTNEKKNLLFDSCARNVYGAVFILRCRAVVGFAVV